MIDYESPITQIVSDMQMGYENGVLKAVQNVGFHVNKEELTKALLYDREQYQKGYVDGLNADTWIHCSEKLPKEGVPVLVCNASGKVYIRQINWISRGRTEIPNWSQNSTGIIAWQPLPAPYQKGE